MNRWSWVFLWHSPLSFFITIRWVLLIGFCSAYSPLKDSHIWQDQIFRKVVLMSWLMRWRSLDKNHVFWRFITLNSILKKSSMMIWWESIRSTPKIKKTKKLSENHWRRIPRIRRRGWIMNLPRGWGNLTKLMTIERHILKK